MADDRALFEYTTWAQRTVAETRETIRRSRELLEQTKPHANQSYWPMDWRRRERDDLRFRRDPAVWSSVR
jgi:hypothetical protein